MNMRPRGAALATVLAVAAILVGLGGLCLALSGARQRTLAHQRAAWQALWNARSGCEAWLASGHLEPRELGAAGSWRAWREPTGDVVFEGLCAGQRRTRVLVGGDPARVREW